jgi:hypothetical protein
VTATETPTQALTGKAISQTAPTWRDTGDERLDAGVAQGWIFANDNAENPTQNVSLVGVGE